MQDTKAAALISWFTEQGGRMPGLALRGRGSRRGLFAQRNIREGAVILHVPRHLVLTLETASNSPLGLRLLDMEAGVHSRFALHMLETRRHGGYWAPMVDALPRSFGCLPLHFNREDWALLDGCDARLWTMRQSEVIRRDHRAIAKRLPKTQRFTLREFSWAWCASTTRSFSLLIGGKELHSLVPVMDMFNHSGEPAAGWPGDHRCGVDVRALRHIRAGEEVTISYGARAGNETLAQYGFCVPDNPADTTSLCYGVPQGHFLRELWPLRYGTVPRTFVFDRDPQGDRTQKLFSFLRLCHLDDIDSARRLPEVMHSDGERVPVLSAENERAMLAALLRGCERRLRGFPSTLAEDERMLADAKLHPRRRFAVMARAGEKRVLGNYVELAQRAQDALALDRDERFAALGEAIAEGGPRRAYFEHLRDRLSADLHLCA